MYKSQYEETPLHAVLSWLGKLLLSLQNLPWVPQRVVHICPLLSQNKCLYYNVFMFCLTVNSFCLSNSRKMPNFPILLDEAKG